MCYCKSVELYDEINESKSYQVKRRSSTEFEEILAKRNKENAFYAVNSSLYDKFTSVIEGTSINLPIRLRKIEYQDIVDKPLEFYKNVVSQGHPCIIKNIVNNWPAFEFWQNNNYLIEKGGELEFTVDITPDGFADSIKGNLFVQPYQKKMTLKKFFTDLSSGKDTQVSYIQKQNNNLEEEFSFLKTDIKDNVREFFSLFFGKEPDASNIWIGTKESVTSLHKDNYENIFVVLKGEKHFTLIPPVYYPFMHPCYYQDARWSFDEEKSSFFIEEGESESRIPWISLNPDYESNKNVLGVDIKRYHAIIEPGDGLYLPPLWYHQVSQFSYEKDVIIGVNYWFDMEYNSNYVLYDLVRNLVDLKP